MSTSDSTLMTNRLQRFAAHHPYRFVLLLLVLFALVLLVFPFIMFFLGIPARLLASGSELFSVLLALFLVLTLHWWREIGFASGLTGQGVTLYIVPIVLIVLPPLGALLAQVMAGSIHTTVADVLYIALLALLVGIAEETFFRGLIMRTLLPKGVWFSAIVSSIIFALVHLTNLLGDLPPAYVLGQLLFAFGVGLLLAALWLRTGSIWPLILLHAIRDFGGLMLINANPGALSSINYQSSLIASGSFSVLMIVYTLFLLRPSQLSRVRAYYTPHLFPHPVPVAESGSESVASESVFHEDASEAAAPPERLRD